MTQKPEIRRQKSESNGAIKSFEALHVFQRAYAISLAVHRASLTFPKVEQYALADQMRRASKSICANIAEGFARQRSSSADFRRFLVMAIGSCDEMRVWVRYAFDLEYVSDTTIAEWRREYGEIVRMLHGLSRHWT